MSPWSEQIRIGFCADRLIWVRVSGGLRRRVIEKLDIEVPPSDAFPVWSSALDTLKARLASGQFKRAGVSVVLSNRLVRYLLVPWHPALMKRAERLAQAKHCFTETYGEAASGWEITMDAGHYGQPVLASAIDHQLLAGLREACKGLSLQSVQPYLTLAYRQFRKTIPSQNTHARYFGVVEPEDLGLIRLGREGLTGVYNQRVNDDWRQSLRGLLLQAATEGDADARVCLLAPGQESIDTEPGSRLSFLKLPVMLGYSPISDERLAMGVVGLS